MFQKRNNGRVRLQGGGDDEGWKTKEETDVTESKKYCKSLSLERSRLELRSVLYLYKRNKNKVFFFLIKFLFIFTWHHHVADTVVLWYVYPLNWNESILY